jgi:hypothetical protein
MKEPSGRVVLPAENPLQSLGKIARPVDIYSRNHRDFWVVGSFLMLCFPIGPNEGLFTGFLPLKIKEAAVKYLQPRNKKPIVVSHNPYPGRSRVR